MTLAQPRGGTSAAFNSAATVSSSRRRRSGAAMSFAALIAMLNLCTVSSSARAQSSGPAYAGTGGTPEAGATCSVAPPLNSSTQGPSISTETVSCSSVSQSAVIYYGIRNDNVVDGDS